MSQGEVKENVVTVSDVAGMAVWGDEDVPSAGNYIAGKLHR